MWVIDNVNIHSPTGMVLMLPLSLRTEQIALENQYKNEYAISLLQNEFVLAEKLTIDTLRPHRQLGRV